MERLTERLKNGQAGVRGCGNDCKYDFKYCDNYLEDCPTINEIYEKLANYEELDEQGKLPRLPVAVGDAVYCISDVFIEPCTVQRIILFNNENGNQTFMMEIYFCRKDCLWVSTEVWCTEIGKTVFLTRDEAENELRRMEAAHEKEKEQPETG